MKTRYWKRPFDEEPNWKLAMGVLFVRAHDEWTPSLWTAETLVANRTVIECDSLGTPLTELPATPSHGITREEFDAFCDRVRRALFEPQPGGDGS